MGIKTLNNKAVSLLEILLAAIILVVSVGGVYYALTSVRLPVVQKERALTSAILGQQLLASLRSSVDARNFYSANGLLANIGAVYTANAAQFPNLDWNTINSGPYVLQYVVTCANRAPACNNDTARRVDVTVTYPDAK